MKTEVTYDQLIVLVTLGGLFVIMLAFYGISQIKRIVRDGLADCALVARNSRRSIESIVRGEEPLSDGEADRIAAAIAAMAQKIESLISRIEELEAGSSATTHVANNYVDNRQPFCTPAQSPIYSSNLGESSAHASVDVPSNVVPLRGKAAEKAKAEKAAAKSPKNSPISAKKQAKNKRSVSKIGAATVKKPQQPATTTSVQ